jgi:hypothetical protein
VRPPIATRRLIAFVTDSAGGGSRAFAKKRQYLYFSTSKARNLTTFC